MQERLRDHAKAFDGLLSLIPAKMYYGEDTSDQWQRKKQTKAEAAAARRNKLDPDSELNRSVKEVMDEQARKKRKRDQMQDEDEDDWSDVEGVEAEKPRQGMKSRAQNDTTKKQRMVDTEAQEISEKERRNEEKRQARKERKAERQMLREEEAAFERQTIKGVNKIKLGKREARTNSESAVGGAASNSSTKSSQSIEKNEPEPVQNSDMRDVDVSGIATAESDEKAEDASASPSEPQSPVFDPNGTPADSTGQAPSTTTSVSSTVPPSEKPKHIKIPQDTEALRARLAAKIQALRDARKADRDGKPIRTRQELIEARRQKEAERKAHKKEVRRQQKAEADRLREEALASARNSPGGILSPAIDADTNFAFGRVGFGDGAQLSHDLTHVLNKGKKKGPSDPKTALQKLENQKKRLREMDEEKRKDVEDKEVWLTARKRAEGEKIKDDEKLLKKAVKRKEQLKKRSTKEWKERSDGVTKAMKEKQKKREENIKKRREEKLMNKAGKKKGGAKKTKGRAGFEGSFKVGGKKR